MGWNVGFFFLPFLYIKDAIDQAVLINLQPKIFGLPFPPTGRL